jgi:hypothetical protein
MVDCMGFKGLVAKMLEIFARLEGHSSDVRPFSKIAVESPDWNPV